jgi:Flp pilus assembly protein TadB
MNIRVWVGAVVCCLLALTQADKRDERGLSQSTENAILVAGAVVVAMALVAAVVAYVNARLPR